ncbi:glycosyltransferase family 9 protein [Polymorphospora sp. NPDC051019]|uniref:glycosyltransferase family 9 protein n=1 Tax=Polymorphospora sp. NPDC051019 TaxID=3155725 RepID=UPI00341BDCB8
MILVLRALGVGDLATVVPALRGLKAAYPDQDLVLAAPRWLVPLVDLVGVVDRLVPVEGLGPAEQPEPAGGAGPEPGGGGGPEPGAGPEPGEWAALDGVTPEVAVNLHGHGPRSHELLLAANPGRLLAFACPAAGHLDGPRWNDDEHEVQRWCRLLRWYGIDTDPGDLGLRRPPPAWLPVGLTIVHPGGKDPARRWPADRWAALARTLDGLGHHIVVTGSADEHDLAEEVAGGAGLPMNAVLAGHTDLAELATLVAYGRMLISGDTGVAHLATAYRTPSVVLFGPVPPRRWAPPPDRPWHRVLWRSDLAGEPAPADRPHPALLAVGPDEVVAAVSEVDRIGQVRDAVTAH